MPARSVHIEARSPIEADLTRRFGREEPLVIFDIGSCEGEDAIRYARLFPNSTVYAVEPLPGNVELIRHNLDLYRLNNVHVVQLALSDRTSEADFFVSSGQPPNAPQGEDWDYGNKSSSLLMPTRHTEIHPWLEFREKVRVSTSTIADLCSGLGVSRIDFIHLDVQGAELMVLTGAGDLLDTVGMVWMEVERIELYQGQPLKDDVERFMRSHGFTKRRDTVGRVSGDQLYERTVLRRGRADRLDHALARAERLGRRVTSRVFHPKRS